MLAGHAAFPQVRGIRHKPTAAPSPDRVESSAPGSMGDPAWRRGYALLAKYGLSFDLQTPWWHLAEAAALARDFPDTPIILNHTGLPADRSAQGLAGWRRALASLAAEPNVALKISGLGQPGRPWTVAANGPIVRDAIAIFGVERCMFASNFPVDGLCADFDTIFSGFKTIVQGFAAAEQRRLFHDNALRIYRLERRRAQSIDSRPGRPDTRATSRHERRTSSFRETSSCSPADPPARSPPAAPPRSSWACPVRRRPRPTSRSPS